MASHRKPKQRSLSSNTVRTAATLALASAATATVFEGTGHAEPNLTPSQVKAKVDQLYRDAEVATEKYNGAKEQAGKAQRSLDTLRDEAARKTGRLNTARNALGSVAAAQYRNGAIDPAVQLALSSKPDQFLERSSIAEQAGSRQAAAITGISRQLRDIQQVRGAADSKLGDLKAEQAKLKTHKGTVTRKLHTAKDLLDRLTAAQRGTYERETGGTNADLTDATGATPASAAHADRGTARGSIEAPSSRAARAVSYAYGALGKPYVWGATGPSAFDCSGLTQAAWKAAGISLPRTTYTQINAGQRIARSQLAPGDLVFFYSGLSHVGLYIGNGRMIHAPHPGAPVRVAPIDQMPFAGGARPA